MARQFSIPFNGTDPEEFMEFIEKYSENVHDVYLGCPGIQDFFTNTLIDKRADYYDNCIGFLELAEEMKVPTVLVCNASYSGSTIQDKNRMIRILQNYIYKYDVSGLVCADIDIAEVIHRIAPDIEINTSCNNPHYNTYSLIEWRDKAGVNLVNPPRDTVRDFKYLKELKNKGFRVKLLINEFCYLNCGRISQFCEVSKTIITCRSIQLKNNALLTCMLFPEQMNKFDEVVDIYKIQGRWSSTNYIFKVLDIYREGRSCGIEEIKESISPELKTFNTSEIDPKLMEYWVTGCQRDCYNCKRCETEFNRIQELHKDDNYIAKEEKI